MDGNIRYSTFISPQPLPQTNRLDLPIMTYNGSFSTTINFNKNNWMSSRNLELNTLDIANKMNIRIPQPKATGMRCAPLITPISYDYNNISMGGIAAIVDDTCKGQKKGGYSGQQYWENIQLLQPSTIFQSNILNIKFLDSNINVEFNFSFESGYISSSDSVTHNSLTNTFNKYTNMNFITFWEFISDCIRQNLKFNIIFTGLSVNLNLVTNLNVNYSDNLIVKSISQPVRTLNQKIQICSNTTTYMRIQIENNINYRYYINFFSINILSKLINTIKLYLKIGRIISTFPINPEFDINNINLILNKCFCMLTLSAIYNPSSTNQKLLIYYVFNGIINTLTDEEITYIYQNIHSINPNIVTQITTKLINSKLSLNDNQKTYSVLGYLGIPKGTSFNDLINQTLSVKLNEVNVVDNTVSQIINIKQNLENTFLLVDGTYPLPLTPLLSITKPTLPAIFRNPNLTPSLD